MLRVTHVNKKIERKNACACTYGVWRWKTKGIYSLVRVGNARPGRLRSPSGFLSLLTRLVYLLLTRPAFPLFGFRLGRRFCLHRL